MMRCDWSQSGSKRYASIEFSGRFALKKALQAEYFHVSIRVCLHFT